MGALAVAETQAAEQRDKQVVQRKDKNIVGKKEDKTDELEMEEGNKRTQENAMDKNNDSEKEIKHTQSTEEEPEEVHLKPTQVSSVEDCSDKGEEKKEVHTQLASITLKPSPAKLSPSGGSGKLNRSRSVNCEHPHVSDNQDCKEKERKYSFNQPMPTSSPPALKL